MKKVIKDTSKVDIRAVQELRDETQERQMKQKLPLLKSLLSVAPDWKIESFPGEKDKDDDDKNF